MADGILCKYCGWQETEHKVQTFIEHPENKLPGYKKSLNDCPGYEPSEPRLAKILQKIGDGTNLTKNDEIFLARRVL